jgi:hypothetical protein
MNAENKKGSKAFCNRPFLGAPILGLIATFCDESRSIFRLMQTCSFYKDALTSNESVWKHLWNISSQFATTLSKHLKGPMEKVKNQAKLLQHWHAIVKGQLIPKKLHLQMPEGFKTITSTQNCWPMYPMVTDHFVLFFAQQTGQQLQCKYAVVCFDLLLDGKHIGSIPASEAKTRGGHLNEHVIFDRFDCANGLLAIGSSSDIKVYSLSGTIKEIECPLVKPTDSTIIQKVKLSGPTSSEQVLTLSCADYMDAAKQVILVLVYSKEKNAFQQTKNIDLLGHRPVVRMSVCWPTLWIQSKSRDEHTSTVLYWNIAQGKFETPQSTFETERIVHLDSAIQTKIFNVRARADRWHYSVNKNKSPIYSSFSNEDSKSDHVFFHSPPGVHVSADAPLMASQNNSKVFDYANMSVFRLPQPWTKLGQPEGKWQIVDLNDRFVVWQHDHQKNDIVVCDFFAITFSASSSQARKKIKSIFDS